MFTTHQSIKAWADDDKPREKLMLKGKHSLSDAEIMAIIIGSGTSKKSAVDLSREILSSVDHNLSRLSKLSMKDLMQFKGVGEAKAVSIIAALEMGRRRKESSTGNRPKILSSQLAFQSLKHHFYDLGHEEFRVLLLNAANHVLKIDLISQGGIRGTVADGKIIFKKALEEGATGMILAHNHPSGNLKPSNADLSLTKKLKEFGSMIDIQVLDHLIITNENYTSLADEGLM